MPPTLETFAAPPTCTRVRFTSDELTSLCPLTGQPDFNTIEIDYAPNLLCIESKSLKLFLWSFRDKGAFCEQLAADIATEVQRAVEPVHVRVTVRQHTRG
ncbi:MAG: 7-cyano-7-deazaguanine reductase, partial [Acidimicrobiaceae bacterium]